jgi:hypothetical protein
MTVDVLETCPFRATPVRRMNERIFQILSEEDH